MEKLRPFLPKVLKYSILQLKNKTGGELVTCLNHSDNLFSAYSFFCMYKHFTNHLYGPSHLKVLTIFCGCLMGWSPEAHIKGFFFESFPKH